MNQAPLDPAVHSAEEAFEHIRKCIEERKSFLLEAGAGSGKTYALVRALRHIIDTRGAQYVKKNQQVACISYTNAASDIIRERTGEHPAISSSTIHAFCWSLIKDHQQYLREELPKTPRWAERLAEVGGVSGRTIEYSLGHPSVRREDKTISIGHADVLKFATKLLGFEKFRRLLASRYPTIFIDEYQDTDSEFVEALRIYILGTDKGPLLGFFGDHWQRIYGRTCGRVEHERLTRIQQGSNFRSHSAIVEMLNRMRPELRQTIRQHAGRGSAVVYHTNDWIGVRQSGPQWKGDLPEKVAHSYLDALRAELESQGWDFSPDKTKILMLTHNVLAKEQGYARIANAFKGRNEAFADKQDEYIKFFVDVLEPACRAYEARSYGDMGLVLGGAAPIVRSYAGKASWAADMDALLELRSTASIGAVLDFLTTTNRVRLPEAVENRERAFKKLSPQAEPEEDLVERLREFRQVPYREISALAHFLDESTLFSTKHGVKGDEFENVLVVVGRGWNLYDFNSFLEMLSQSTVVVPPPKADSYERNRNLLYVAFSRARVRLAVLFTQELSSQALSTLSYLFGDGNVRPCKSS